MNTIQNSGLIQNTQAFLTALGLTEEPMGLFYTRDKPAKGCCPKPQTPLCRLSRGSNYEVNWSSCVLGKVRRARREKGAAYFDQPFSQQGYRVKWRGSNMLILLKQDRCFTMHFNPQRPLLLCLSYSH